MAESVDFYEMIETLKESNGTQACTIKINDDDKIEIEYANVSESNFIKITLGCCGSYEITSDTEDDDDDDYEEWNRGHTVSSGGFFSPVSAMDMYNNVYPPPPPVFRPPPYGMQPPQFVNNVDQRNYVNLQQVLYPRQESNRGINDIFSTTVLIEDTIKDSLMAIDPRNRGVLIGPSNRLSENLSWEDSGIGDPGDRGISMAMTSQQVMLTTDIMITVTRIMTVSTITPGRPNELLVGKYVKPNGEELTIYGFTLSRS